MATAEIEDECMAAYGTRDPDSGMIIMENHRFFSI